ncbi:hypothetical protein CLV88_11188 [Shimia abyssi]|uniref:Uncharacterized protein n=2 Tax=Shimia abyssi TaxID=1662395 RepID=A0A2P8F9E7_9RHOB|nr:hypothetical protein CLV88_11188 [Shimia abyssi]
MVVESRLVKPVDYLMPNNSLRERIDFQDRYHFRDGRDIDPSEYPTAIFLIFATCRHVSARFQMSS